jgi:hypothetical protein
VFQDRGRAREDILFTIAKRKINNVQRINLTPIHEGLKRSRKRISYLTIKELEFISLTVGGRRA